RQFALLFHPCYRMKHRRTSTEAADPNRCRRGPTDPKGHTKLLTQRRKSTLAVVNEMPLELPPSCQRTMPVDHRRNGFPPAFAADGLQQSQIHLMLLETMCAKMVGRTIVLGSNRFVKEPGRENFEDPAN